jgi:hypothetical protein
MKEGSMDLVAAIALATVYRATAYMGTAYRIPAFWVPALSVTYYIKRIILGKYWARPDTPSMKGQEQSGKSGKRG